MQAKLYCTVSSEHDVTQGFIDFVCPACGSELDVSPITADDVSSVISDDRGSVWRYSSLIPVEYDSRLDEGAEVSIHASHALAEELGVEAVYLLDATRLATGTFKDYEANVIAGACVQAGVDRISVHSTGNTALAYQSYARMVAVSCAAFVPAVNLDKMGPTESSDLWPVYPLEVGFPEVSAIAKSAAAKEGWRHMAPLRWKLQGKAVLAWQLLEQCPDVNVIVQTVAGGYGPLGMEEGFARLPNALAGSRLRERRYALFQPSDADGLGRAWRDGRTDTSLADLQLPTDPYESTLQSTNPVATLPRLREQLPVDTTIESVSPTIIEDNVEWGLEICNNAGVHLDPQREKSALIALAGMRYTRFSPQDRLALVVSGSSPFKHGGN